METNWKDVGTLFVNRLYTNSFSLTVMLFYFSPLKLFTDVYFLPWNGIVHGILSCCEVLITVTELETVHPLTKIWFMFVNLTHVFSRDSSLLQWNVNSKNCLIRLVSRVYMYSYIERTFTCELYGMLLQNETNYPVFEFKLGISCKDIMSF